MTASALDLDMVDVEALTTVLQPEPDPEPEQHPTSEEKLDKVAPSVAVAINEALNTLYPGDSKTAKDRRKRIWDALWNELHDVVVWGVELTNGRLPIGDPVIFGNAIVEVDAYGDAVSFTTTDRAWPLWDPK